MRERAKSERKVKQLAKRVRATKANIIEVGGRPVDTIEAEIRVEVAACETALTKGLTHALKAGWLLIELKGRVEHGEFLPAVERCGLKPRTAQDYMRVATRWPEIEKYATSAHLTLREAIAGLTRVGAGDILEDFQEENYRMPEPQEPAALPPAWSKPSLPPAQAGTEIPQPAPLQTDTALQAFQKPSVEANLASARLFKRVQKVEGALVNAIEKYKELVLCIKWLGQEKRAVRTEGFPDLDSGFATLANLHNQVTPMLTVLDQYARAANTTQQPSDQKSEVIDETPREEAAA